MDDNWAIWIRALRRQKEQSSEVATKRDSSDSQDRKESPTASVTPAVHWSESPDIQDQMDAAVHETAAMVDRDRFHASGRGFLNTSIVVRNRLGSSHAQCHKMDRSTDRAQCCGESSAIVPRQES